MAGVGETTKREGWSVAAEVCEAVRLVVGGKTDSGCRSAPGLMKNGLHWGCADGCATVNTLKMTELYNLK